MTEMSVRRKQTGYALVSLLLLTACANDRVGGAGATLAPRQAASAPRLVAEPTADPVAVTPERSRAADIDRVKTILGSNRNFRSPPRPAETDDAAGPILVNFENGDIREIVRNLLGDALGEGFIIDPAVTGTVTVRTAKGLKRSDIIPTLEVLLRTVKAVLVKDGNYWRVLPEGGVNLGTVPPRIQLKPGNGNSVVIFPVKHVGAKELEKVILPFVKAGTPAAIRTDELRNLLFFSGTEAEIRNMLEIAEMFDVNVLTGMSFLLFPLESSDVKTVVADWEKIFPATANPFAGLLRVVPIERMNAVLLISPQRDMIIDARDWLERLDKGSDAGGGARLYVYNVLFSQAEKLQVILQQAITGRANPAAASVAPGQTANTLTAPISPIAGQGLVQPGNTAFTPPANVQRPVTAAPGTANNQALGLARNATVIADKDRNALLIVATPAEYAAIESAIKKLDTAPKMIAIEVQIAQVALNGAFQFGISGMFTGKPESAANRLTSEGGVGSLNTAATATGAAVSGFSYTWQGAAAKAILSTLQTTGQSRTIASPTMITLDNQKVSFTNGTQISVQTQSTIASGTTSATNSFQYINTGLTINITPRVSGNNVFLEIQQQSSTAGAVRADNPNPDITQNSQQTTVMVGNGDTMLLSGLFVDSANQGTGGLPFVSTIPILGGLFGTQSWNSSRSELVMLVTPRIMTTVEETRGVVDELRQRMNSIENLMPALGTRELPSSVDAKKEVQFRRDQQKIPLEFNQSLKIQPDTSQ